MAIKMVFYDKLMYTVHESCTVASKDSTSSVRVVV